MTVLHKISKRWSLITLAIVFLLLIPILTIVLKIVDGPGESWGHISKYLLLDYIQNSVFLLFTCSFLSLLLGVIPAWLVSRYEFPFQKSLEWMLILPLAIPNYLIAYAYAGIFDYAGAFEQFVTFFHLDFLIPKRIEVMNLWGLASILSFSLFPYVYLNAKNFFVNQSSSQIKAAQVLGAKEFSIFYKIAVPMARPAIMGGLLLVLMEVLSDYGASHYYGVSTFSTAIFRSWFALEEPETAVYLSALLCLFILAIILFERFQRRKKRFSFSHGCAEKITKREAKGLFKYALSLACLLPVAFGFLFPISQMIYWAFLTASEVWNEEFFLLIRDSFLVAFLASILCVCIAFFILYGSKWSRWIFMKSISKLSILGYAVPGVVIAIGIMIPSLLVDKYLLRFVQENFSYNIGFIISGTLVALLFAYCVRFLAVSYNTLEADIEKTGDGLEQASEVLGVSKWKRSLKVNIPILKTALFSSLLMVFVDVIKELPLTLILKPYGLMTLSVRAYEYASDEMIAESALPSIIIIGIGLVPILCLNKLMRR